MTIITSTPSLCKFVSNDRRAIFSTPAEDLELFQNKLEGYNLHELLLKPMRNYFRITIEPLDRSSLEEMANRLILPFSPRERKSDQGRDNP